MARIRAALQCAVDELRILGPEHVGSEALDRAEGDVDEVLQAMQARLRRPESRSEAIEEFGVDWPRFEVEGTSQVLETNGSEPSVNEYEIIMLDSEAIRSQQTPGEEVVYERFPVDDRRDHLSSSLHFQHRIGRELGAVLRACVREGTVKMLPDGSGFGYRLGPSRRDFDCRCEESRCRQYMLMFSELIRGECMPAPYLEDFLPNVEGSVKWSASKCRFENHWSDCAGQPLVQTILEWTWPGGRLSSIEESRLVPGSLDPWREYTLDLRYEAPGFESPGLPSRWSPKPGTLVFDSRFHDQAVGYRVDEDGKIPSDSQIRKLARAYSGAGGGR